VKCPRCGHEEDKVVDSRSSKEGEAIRRRRECLQCGQRFTTYEYIEKTPLNVVKRDGRREPFSRQKLINGMLAACTKRPVSVEKIEAIADEIEREISESASSEISSLAIGEKVMEKLKDVDEVSYVRFASVYRKFEDASEFHKVIKGLSEDKPAGNEK
jgi:transcriptional repressor NrdR